MAREGRWWRVHQWVGLKLSLLLSFVLLTGTLAVLGHEIDWLLRPALRVAPATAGDAVNWRAIARSAAQSAPGARIVSLDAPVDRWFAASATVSWPKPPHEDRLGFLYFHPASGALQGPGHWAGAQRALRNLHRHLMLPTRIGVPIVASLALLLLISLLTSFLVYKKWWRGYLRPIRTQRARVGWGDFHRLAGVWSLWFVALIALTGMWYLIESLGGDAPSLPRAGSAPVALESRQLAAALPAILAAAQAAFPGLKVQRIVFPNESNGAFKFEGQHRAVLVRVRANVVWVSAADARVLRVSDARELSLHQRISELADPLHFGDFGGLALKLLWFFFGLLLTGLAISGAAIYTTRLTNTSRWQQIWHGMGALHWPAALLVLIGLALLPTLWLSRASAP